MTLSSRLQEDMTNAIRARDELRRDTLRMVIAAAYNVQKAAGRELSDDEVLQVLARAVKTRRESIEAYSAAGRDEAAAREQAEIDIVSAYLPAQLSESEVDQIVKETIDEIGASSPRDMGKVMAALVPRTRGRADGKQVSAAVARELAARDLAGHDQGH
ncbi:MAG: GatB/YqeY domain-containing protein [Chloroflexota bacterium]